MSQEPIQQSYDNNSQIRTAVNRLTELLEWLYPDPSPDIFTVRDYRNRYPFTRLGALATDDIDRYQRINRAIGNHVQIGLCEFHIGLIYLHEADFHGAVQQFELARQQWSFVSQPAAVSLTHLARAVALQFAHHYEAALVSVGRVASWLERSRFAKPVPGWPDFEARVMAYVAELQGQLRKQMECESKTAESPQEEAAAEESTPDEPVVNDELDTSEHPIAPMPDPEAETRPDGEIITGAPTPAPIVNLTKSDANKPIPGHQQVNQKYQWYVVEVRPSSQFMPDINHGDWLLVDMTPNFPHDVRDTEQPILIVKKEEIDDTIRVRPLAAEQRFPRIYLVTLADSLTGSFWRDEVTGTVTFAQERGKIDVNSSEILGVVVGYWRPMYAQSSAG